MRYITEHRRLRRLALIASISTAIAVYAIVAGHQTSWSQQSTPNKVTADLNFLVQQSVLFQADQVAEQISGMGKQWDNAYGSPEPDRVVQTASVWFLYYPASVIPKPGASVFGTWADPQYWTTLQDLGITLQHTEPVERAGGICGTTFTPTTDGWFDRISLDLDPQFGTEAEFKQMFSVAEQHGAIIGSDLVPLHTGLGSDFQLAQMAYQDYPGLYSMVEIAQSDWGLLPTVSEPCQTALVTDDQAVQLKQKGYIPGIVPSADANPEAATWSSWSATPPVVGVDGKTRRWVYLHIFKPTEATMDWLDPSNAAERYQFGDAGRNILDRGVRVLRLDAAPFLGLDPNPNSNMAITYLDPESINGTNYLAFAIRKLGGWSFQELNVPIPQLVQFSTNGPDISYDFFTRAQVLHPLITGDAFPLRLAFNLLLQGGVQDGTLFHDLQNHDEITYQLIDLGSRGNIQFEGKTVNGAQLKQQILQQMRSTVGSVPYNKLYRPVQDGVATTFAGFIAPALGIQDPYHATPEQVALIQQAHFLVALANAMQPGIFGISAWDLVGALPVPVTSISPTLTAGGDWRWINRGAVDLLDENPSATKSAVLGLPKAVALYGSVPDQLKSPNSFASQILQMLAVRKQYSIDQGQLLVVPDVGNTAVCVLIMSLPNSKGLAITALNYGRSNTSIKVDLSNIPGIPAASTAGQTALDIIANQNAGTVSSDSQLSVTLNALSGRAIVLPGVAEIPPPSGTPSPSGTPTPNPGS